MNSHDATEQAYRNGYEAGYKAAKDEIVKCKNCVFGTWKGTFFRCQIFSTGDSFVDPDFDSEDFCSYGYRKEET